MDAKQLQQALKERGLYKDFIDGDLGPNSQLAMQQLLDKHGVAWLGWPSSRIAQASKQIIYLEAGFSPGLIDGFNGPMTMKAEAQYAVRSKPAEVAALEGQKPVSNVVLTPAQARAKWPRQRDAAAFFGAVGTNHKRLDMPFPMRYGEPPNQIIPYTFVNAKIHDAMLRIWNKTKEHYGYEKLKEIRLDVFSGCYNPRSMLGSNRPSMHGYACAWDVDAVNNQLYWGRNLAWLAKPVYEPFWGFVEGEGAISLGRHANYDYMHFQFTSDFS